MLRGVFQIFGEINEVSWILKVDHEPLIFIIVAGGWGQPWPPSFAEVCLTQIVPAYGR
jgi:hypothetical protein